MTKILALAALLIVWNLSVAQDLVITNARIIDGTGEIIENGSVVVTAGRIASVSPGAPDFQSSMVIDAEGMTLMPGMIDTHVHLLVTDRSFETQESLDRWADESLPTYLLSYLESGFTTVLSAGDHPLTIARVKERLVAGDLVGPSLLISGPIFTAPGAHPATTICGRSPPFCREQFAVEVDDPGVARQRVHELAELGVDAIKAVYQNNPPHQRLSDDVLAAIADEAHRNDLPLILHTEQVELALRAIELGADNFVHPPVENVVDLSEVSEALNKAVVPFSTTTRGSAPAIDETGVARNNRGQVFTEENQARHNQKLSGIRTLWDAGVTVAFGTDRSRHDPAEDVAQEIEVLSGVLSPAEIIAALTRNAAIFLDIEDEIGTIEPGKLANIVIIDGDPLADISNLANVEIVIQGGRVVVDNR